MPQRARSRQSPLKDCRKPSKPQFVGERVRLGKLLLDTFSGEWGTEEGESLTPVLRTSNFNEDGSLDYSTPAMRCIPERKVAKKRMVRGDIILEKSGGTPKRPVGIMAFYDSDELALCSNFNQVLRFDEDRILSRFAFHQLRWLKDRNAFERFTRKTTGLQNLQMKKLIELKLHVPQIEAQTMIADTLDKIVDNQRTLQREIIDLDSLVKSRFVEMFGDITEQYLLGDRLETTSGGTPSRKHPEYYEDGTIPWLTSGEVNKGKIDTPDHYITEAGLCNSSAKLVPANSVVVAMYGATAGQVGLVTYETTTNQAVCCIKPNAQVAPVFLRYALEFKKDWMIGQCAGGAQPNISQGIVKKVAIPDVTLARQQEFADFVSAVDKSRFVDLS